MNESIGTASIFYIMIIFISVLALFLVGSIGYSKAYKVKNKIVEEIEKHKGYTLEAGLEIEKWLQGTSSDSSGNGGIGYRQRTSNMSYSTNCNDPKLKEDVNAITYQVDNDIRAVMAELNSRYNYCVYSKTTCDSVAEGSQSCGTHYKVVAFMYIDLPLVNQISNKPLEVPVIGETMTFRSEIEKDGE